MEGDATKDMEWWSEAGGAVLVRHRWPPPPHPRTALDKYQKLPAPYTAGWAAAWAKMLKLVTGEDYGTREWAAALAKARRAPNLIITWYAQPIPARPCCKQCAKPIPKKARADAVFCSTACRMQAYRRRHGLLSRR